MTEKVYFDILYIQKLEFLTFIHMVKDGKIVQTHAKGMVTIPAEFRAKLGIEEDTLLKATLIKDGVIFVKIKYISGPEKNPPSNSEVYSDRQIKQWLAEDKLDPRTAAKLKKLFKK